MSRRPQPTVFVLWGSFFDEATAVLVVTTLRQAGVRVKLVGLDGPCVKGRHGLGLQVDLSLEEAGRMAGQVACVVIPSTMHGLEGVLGDVRVREFLGRFVGRAG